MYLYATHPMVHPEITALAENLFRPALEQAFRDHGLSAYWYHTTSSRTDDKLVAMGGNAPGIARNTFGLMGAVSFLIETRGVGVGLEAYQRRVATHVMAARAIIGTAAGEAARLHQTVVAARAAADPRDLVVAHRLAVEPVTLPMLDPATGGARQTEVRFQDSRAVTPVTSRARPAGYIVQGSAAAIAVQLSLNGAALCLLAGSASIEAEKFVLKGPIKAVNRETINPEQAVDVRLAPATLELPAGTLYVPMNQSAAAIIAAALEPDSPGSFVGTGVLPLPAEAREPPIYRVNAIAAKALELAPLTPASARACANAQPR